MEYTVNNLGTSALINDLIVPECCLFHFSPLSSTPQSGLTFIQGKIRILYLPYDKTLPEGLKYYCENSPYNPWIC